MIFLHSLLKKDFSAMETHLDKAYSDVLNLKRVALAKELVVLYHYRALAKHLQKEDPIPMWRKAFTLHPTFEWDSLIDDKNASEVFYLIREEIGYARRSSAFVPSKKGRAKTYVDGVAIDHKSKVLPGQHLLQIECPKGEIFARWSPLQEDPQWLAMCPYEIDVNDVEVDPFSMDSLDLDESEEDPSTEEDPVEVHKSDGPKDDQPSLSGNDYMKGLKVEKVTAKENLFVGGAIGYQTDLYAHLLHAVADMVYRMQDAWELEVGVGSTLSLGGNIITPFGVIGPYTGLQFYGANFEVFGFVGARYRYDIQLSHQLEAFTRIEGQYLFSDDDYTLFTGQIGLRYKIF